MILNILGAAALGHLGAEFLSQFERLPQKPFKCNMCLTFWLSILPFVYIYGYDGLLASALASIVSELIYKYLWHQKTYSGLKTTC